jgi:hypothetical protein
MGQISQARHYAGLLRNCPTANLSSNEGVFPKRGVLQPREGSSIRTASGRSFVPPEKRLHSGRPAGSADKFKLNHYRALSGIDTSPERPKDEFTNSLFTPRPFFQPTPARGCDLSYL